MRGRADRRLDRRPPLLGELSDRLSGLLDEDAGVDLAHHLRERALGGLLGRVAAVPLLPPLVRDRLPTEVDDDAVPLAALDDAASHRFAFLLAASRRRYSREACALAHSAEQYRIPSVRFWP